MPTDTLLLIDLSSLARPIFEVSGKEHQDWTSQQVVARVRALASEHPHAAICCDSGRDSFRRKIDPTYKANRGETPASYLYQVAMAQEALKADGFPVWQVSGFEADDIIASATRQALACDGDVLIASSDKDLLALVGEKVQVKSLTSGSVLDVAGVISKFKVRPDQMLDYLSLVGDTADNVQGAKGIGGVTASKLLDEYQNIATIYASIDDGSATLPPAQYNSLTEFRDRWPTVRSLLALRSDVELPFHEISAERTVRPMSIEEEPATEGAEYATSEPVRQTGTAADRPEQRQVQSGPKPEPSSSSQALIAREPAPAEWERGLEPRSMNDAVQLAQRMFESRLFSAYGTPQAVLATVLAGRELGIPAMASLRAFHVIEGKPVLSAGAIQSLVMRSGKARYFRCIERTAERATFETQRLGENEAPFSLSFSIEEGRRAFAGDDKAFAKSGWARNPADMCVARASSKLARLVYPDVVSGLYAPEEFD